jgi:hypothetical protein
MNPTERIISLLQSFVKVRSCNLLGKVTIRLSLKLIHDDAENATASFMSSTAGSLHHSQVAASADCVTGLSE